MTDKSLPSLDQWRKILVMMERIDGDKTASPSQIVYWTYPTYYAAQPYNPYYGSTIGGTYTTTGATGASQLLTTDVAWSK